MVCFGAFPALICYLLGVRGTLGLILVFFYCTCAVIRLAFFNVLEGNRQRTEGGCNKTYRGLPVTSISIYLPIIFMFRNCLGSQVFAALLHAVMAVTAFLFVLDFSVKKPDWSKLLPRCR